MGGYAPGKEGKKVIMILFLMFFCLWLKCIQEEGEGGDCETKGQIINYRL